MISGEQMITFVWRCPDCASAYEGEESVEGTLGGGQDRHINIFSI